MTGRQTGALIAMQSALMTAFKADTALMSLTGGRLSDGVPKSEVTPYLMFSGASGDDWSSNDGPGARLRLEIDVIGADPERARVVAILDRAVTVATSGMLLMPAGHLVLIRQSGMDVRRLSDGRSWRARATLDALVDE